MRLPVRAVSSCLVVMLTVQTPAVAFTRDRPAAYRRLSPRGAGRASADSHPVRSPDLPAADLFYAKDFSAAESVLLPLKERHDRSYALWCNQLGSVYLAAGNTPAALQQFSEAFLVMNSIDAFRNLETQALRITGEESAKGYKGDPYEKVFNSFYLALLLYANQDTENALAALRNGILCDSDVVSQAYKSDAAFLYLLAARLERQRGNGSLADDYLRQAQQAYYLSHPLNRDLVWQEQGAHSALAAVRAELSAERPKRRSRDVEALKNEAGRLEQEIGELTRQRMAQSATIETDSLFGVADPGQNVLIVVELGKSPVKRGEGRYGERAVFEELPYAVKHVRVKRGAFFAVPDSAVFKYNDVYYQASTRGGRKMDAILAGKAQFKRTTAEASDLFAQLGIVVAAEAEGQRSDKRDKAYGAAGVLFLAGILSSLLSSATRPQADLRAWSFLPAEVQVVPVHLEPGLHRLSVECLDDRWQRLEGWDQTLEVTVEAGRPAVVFTRIFE